MQVRRGSLYEFIATHFTKHRNGLRVIGDPTDDCRICLSTASPYGTGDMKTRAVVPCKPSKSYIQNESETLFSGACMCRMHRLCVERSLIQRLQKRATLDAGNNGMVTVTFKVDCGCRSRIEIESDRLDPTVYRLSTLDLARSQVLQRPLQIIYLAVNPFHDKGSSRLFDFL